MPKPAGSTRQSCSARPTATGLASASIPEGLELQKGSTALRLFFPQRVTGPGPLRAVLKQLADGGAGEMTGGLDASVTRVLMD